MDHFQLLLLNVDLEIYMRILISALLGMLLGYDRTSKSKPAGIKTFTFVTVSTTLITIISIFALKCMAPQTKIIEWIRCD